MKKKDTLSYKDIKDWKNFLDDNSRIPDKDLNNQLKNSNTVYRFDLHGFTLVEANKKVKKSIKKYFS